LRQGAQASSAKRGVSYDKASAGREPPVALNVGQQRIAGFDEKAYVAALAAALEDHPRHRDHGGAVGHDLRPGRRHPGRDVPGAHPLHVDVVPYHIGSGYFGGFLPLISQYIVVRPAMPMPGLWYTIAVVAMAFVVSAIWLPETYRKGRL
jgi:hypothetical protein